MTREDTLTILELLKKRYSEMKAAAEKEVCSSIRYECRLQCEGFKQAIDLIRAEL